MEQSCHIKTHPLTVPFTTRSIPRLKSVAAGFTFEEGRGGAAGRQGKRRTLSSDAESLSGAATTLLSLHGTTIVAMAVTARQVVAAVSAGQGTACSSLHIVKLADYSVESFNLQGESHLLSCNVRAGSEKGREQRHGLTLPHLSFRLPHLPVFPPARAAAAQRKPLDCRIQLDAPGSSRRAHHARQEKLG